MCKRFDATFDAARKRGLRYMRGPGPGWPWIASGAPGGRAGDLLESDHMEVTFDLAIACASAPAWPAHPGRNWQILPVVLLGRGHFQKFTWTVDQDHAPSAVNDVQVQAGVGLAGNPLTLARKSACMCCRLAGHRFAERPFNLVHVKYAPTAVRRRQGRKRP